MMSSALYRTSAWHPQLLRGKLSQQHTSFSKLRKIHISCGPMIWNKSVHGASCGKASIGALKVVNPRSIIVRGFLNKLPKGGFFFAGTLAPDPLEDAEIAANMVEVAKIEKAEKEEACNRVAANTEIKRGLAQVILRELPNVQLVRSDMATKETDTCSCEPKQSVKSEEYLRTEYYKNFHKGHYDLKHFYAAGKE